MKFKIKEIFVSENVNLNKVTDFVSQILVNLAVLY